MTPNTIREIYYRLEQEHDIVLSHITIKAIADSEYNHAGWVIPGSRVIKNKTAAEIVAKRLNNLCQDLTRL